jgi:hypothetical protein
MSVHVAFGEKVCGSNRRVEALPVPSILSPEEIIAKYWFRHYQQINDLSNKGYYNQWYVLACMLNVLPGMVECAGDIIQPAINTCLNLSQLNSMMGQLLPVIEASIRSRFSLSNIPEPRELFHIVHRRKIEMNSKAKECFRNSLMSNVAEYSFRESTEYPMYLIPESSLMLLAIAAMTDNTSVVAPYIVKLYERIKSVVIDPGYAKGAMTAGLTLKEFFILWTQIRIKSSSVYLEGQVTLDDYGVDYITTIGEEDFNAVKLMTESTNKVEIQKDLPSLRESVELFRDYVEENMSSDNINLSSSGEGDYFDVMLTVTLKDDKLPFVIFYDCTSCEESGPVASDYLSKTFKKYERAKSLNACISQLKDSSKANESPIISALTQGRYAYVYTTTCSLTYDDSPVLPPHTSLMDQKKMEQYMTITYDLYTTIRRVLKDKPIKLKRSKTKKTCD